MKAKKVLALLLSLILAVACFAGLAVQSSAATVIDTVQIDGIVAPAIGAHPEVAGITVPSGSNYTIVETNKGDFQLFENGNVTQFWRDTTEKVWLKKTDTFKAGRNYSLWLSLVPKSGYSFAEPSKMKFDAGFLSGVVKKCTFNKSGYTDGRIVFNIDFKTLTPPIESVAVTGVPTPIIGKQIDVSNIQVSEGFQLASVSVQYRSGKNWKTFSGNVSESGSYRVALFLSTLPGYTYTSTISGTVNGRDKDVYGNAVSVGKTSGQYVIYYMLEPPTVKAEIKIKNYVSERTVDYATAITFTAETIEAPEGATIRWKVYWEQGGNSYGEGSSYTVSKNKDGKRIDEGYYIEARLYSAEGVLYGTSETETVHVKAGFFNKLVWMFKHIFQPGAYRITQ